MRTPVTVPYHHGDLRNALVEAAVGLAREGGTNAVVLREAARRVGVSPTAAYRHFDSLPDLVQAVALQAMAAMARSMEAELASARPRGDQVSRALSRVHAIGRGYVHFALAEPGLFAVAFSHRPEEADMTAATGASGLTPWELLEGAMADLLEAGGLDPRNRESAPMAAWAVVHGLSVLLLGPLSEITGKEREALIESTLTLSAQGFLARP